VNENIEPLLIEQPLLNTNSTEDACICTNNTVVNIDLNESTDIVENVKGFPNMEGFLINYQKCNNYLLVDLNMFHLICDYPGHLFD
jgi:hypothetical protein